MRAKGILIASAAASLILGGAVFAADDAKKGDDTVHCAGVNACKGQAACSTAENSCAGTNSCKGKGWVEMSAAECTKKGGKVTAPKKEM